MNSEAYREAVAQGVSLARSRRYAPAAEAFAKACALMPESASAWRALGDMRFALGDWGGSNEAHLKSLDCPPDHRLVAARADIEADRLGQAYALLRERLAATPTDIGALATMADLALRTGRAADAAGLLHRALDLAPGYDDAWLQLAATLERLPAAEALDAVREWRAARPDVWGYRTLEAGMLERIGDYEGARATLTAMLAERPDEAGLTVHLGYILRTLGRTDDAIAAYRRAAALRPESAEPWWALSDIKSFRFTDVDIAAITRIIAESPSAENRSFAHFALGRAYELLGKYKESFGHYAEGNALKREVAGYDRAAMGRDIQQASALFTAEFFAAREGWGCQARDPIFIVGMPRSGSTLIEQILASHPAIEATRELSDLPAIVQDLARSWRARGESYPEAIGRLSAAEVRELGERYLDQTRSQRHTDRPFFIDKLPANFAHAGLIRLILPNARIIDVRRDPVACGFSIFRQYFAGGYLYAFDLADIASHYAGYLATMALWDERMPGFVHHLQYESLVADLEDETRRLMAYLDIPFDPACLTFFETRRPIRTPSNEQVRHPINRSGLDSWQPYAAWLAPLTDLMTEGSGT